jgi:hypothetical protein
MDMPATPERVWQRPGTSHLGRHIDGNGHDRTAQHRSEPFRIVDAVLQAEDHGVGSQMRRHLPPHLLRIARLHAEQHELRARDPIGGHGALDWDAVRLAADLEKQTPRADGLDMLRPADQRDGRTGARQQPAIEAADGAGSHYGNLHGAIPVTAGRDAMRRTPQAARNTPPSSLNAARWWSMSPNMFSMTVRRLR